MICNDGDNEGDMIEQAVWVVFCAWFAGGFVNGISGMGAALVAIPILLLQMPFLDAIVISGVPATILSASQGWLYRHTSKLRSIPPMLAGSIPGGLAGIIILRFIPGSVLEFMMGLGLTCYIIWLLLHRSGMIAHGDSWQKGCLAGFFSGVVGVPTGLCGVPVGIYAVYAGWEKKAVLGTLCLYATGICLLTNVLHGLSDYYTPWRIKLAVCGVLGALAGLWTSIPVCRHISASLFQKILLTVIGVAGISCMMRGLSSLRFWAE